MWKWREKPWYIFYPSHPMSSANVMCPFICCCSIHDVVMTGSVTFTHKWFARLYIFSLSYTIRTLPAKFLVTVATIVTWLHLYLSLVITAIVWGNTNSCVFILCLELSSDWSAETVFPNMVSDLPNWSSGTMIDASLEKSTVSDITAWLWHVHRKSMSAWNNSVMSGAYGPAHVYWRQIHSTDWLHMHDGTYMAK